MPKAFLIRSRSAFPTPYSKKDNVSGLNDENSDGNAQPTGISEHFKRDSPVVGYTIRASSSDQILPANDVEKNLYTGHVRDFERSESQDEIQEASRSTLEIPKYPVVDTKVNHRGRKKSKRALEHHSEDFTDNCVQKKPRKGQTKRKVVYYYETAEETKARENNGSHKPPKDDSRYIRNYTHEKRHYANEPSRYHNHEQGTQSPGTSTDNFYSNGVCKQTGSFAIQNSQESLEQRQTTSKDTQKNNDILDKNVGLENVMIVEYHSVRGNRGNDQKIRENVTQRTSQGYYVPSRSTPPSVHSSNYKPVSSNVTTTVPAQVSPPQRAPVSVVKQENIREPETKVVYVPVYPVSQGPNGVIYEAIPNATPILAKDTVQVQPSQPEPQQTQRQEQSVPQMVQPGQEVHVRRVSSSPPGPRKEQKSGIEYRAYEPRIPHQLTAAPAPQPFQPHPQGHVMSQPQTAEAITLVSSPPFSRHSSRAVEVPNYQASRPSRPHQYQPRAERPQTSHITSAPQQRGYPATVNSRGPEQVQHYQPAITAVPVSQPYQEIPAHQYRQQQNQHHSYQRSGITVQPAYGPPVISTQQVYQERVDQTRPPPLPSQPQHAEKPALPSPSYPQESANRLPTPRYTPDSVNREQKFVYAPPPSDFMNSPVYRVPKNDDKNKNDGHYNNGRVSNKIGSKKRKSSFPTHTVMPRKIEEHQEIPSPVDNNYRITSPKETDLRCNERLVKSPKQPSPLNRSSLVITPPVSPTEGEDENIETVTVVVRDRGIQASPKVDHNKKTLEHTCYKRAVRSGSYHSESSEEEFLEEENFEKKNSNDIELKSQVGPQSDEYEEENGMYTPDGTLVVRIPYSANNNNSKKQRTKKGNYRFVCRFCNKGFQWHSHLESHERTHTGEKPFKCPECDRAFCRADGLQCHMLVHNKKRPYKCPYCGKGFNDKIVLEKHIYSHTGVKPFKCEYCGRAFSDSLSIEKHLLVHTGTKPYKCPYCVRSFNDSQMLVRHIRSHTGEKPFKCKHCPMAFSKQSALIIHTRVHTGEKPYQCPHCIKSFSISGNLQRHILIHTGERPYKCSKCPKAFNNPSHLSRHISKLHAPQPATTKDQIKYEQFQSEQPYCSPQEV